MILGCEVNNELEWMFCKCSLGKKCGRRARFNWNRTVVLLFLVAHHPNLDGIK